MQQTLNFCELKAASDYSRYQNEYITLKTSCTIGLNSTISFMKWKCCSTRLYNAKKVQNKWELLNTKLK